jgi:hypothetical protein
MTLVVVANSTDVESTWASIQGRISRNPTFQVVDEDAIATIESVIMHHHDEAYDSWPSFSLADKKCRVHFWKGCVLDAVPDEKRGLFAVYFHEYVAAIERGEQSEEDEPGCIPSYGGHARAAHDAYVACTASLT